MGMKIDRSTRGRKGDFPLLSLLQKGEQSFVALTWIKTIELLFERIGHEKTMLNRHRLRSILIPAGEKEANFANSCKIILPWRKGLCYKLNSNHCVTREI